MLNKTLQFLWSVFWIIAAGCSVIGAVCGSLASAILYICCIELANTTYQYAFEKGIFNYAIQRKM